LSTSAPPKALGDAMANEQTFTFVFGRVLSGIESIPNKELAKRFREGFEKNSLKIRKDYATINNFIKQKYMENPPKGEDKRLDRHKTAAVFMVAFLEYFAEVERNLDKEYFAIFIGMLILKIFIRLECKKNNDLGLINLIDENKGFLFPECTRNEGDFIYNWALGMNFDRARDKLSVLSLANIIFLIECHNREFAQKPL